MIAERSPNPLRVLLVDDHALVRSAVRQAITAPDVEVVGDAATAEDALRLALDLRPELILLDINLPGRSGLQVIRELVQGVPEAKIVMLTVSTARQDVIDAVRLGAIGYLSKDSSPEGLLRSVRAASTGDLPMPRWLAARLIRDLADVSRVAPEAVDGDGLVLERLSRREREVLRLLSDGLTDREIANQLTLSPRTVESHVASILHKLNARNRAAAARLYRQT